MLSTVNWKHIGSYRHIGHTRLTSRAVYMTSLGGAKIVVG